MQRFLIAASAPVVILVTACSDASAPSSAPSAEQSNQIAISMASASTNVPAGFSELNSSFVGDEGMAFEPSFNRFGDDDHRGLFGHGFRGPGFGLGLGFMGGG